ncbi:hypothetical protein FOA52_000841 [Chlamydomonas sp. UWO 241]|nr:hypothetical protein FOA52_000841 [Chlamydomonas sp. UWO 241]
MGTGKPNRVKRILMKFGIAKLKARVLIVGLCNSGKTTIVRALAKQRTDEAAPTTGFEVETFKMNGKAGKVKLTTFDMSGDPKYQSLWQSFYEGANGVVFVVDAANAAQFGEAKSTLWGIMEKAPKALPVLVLVNKADLPASLSPLEVAHALGIDAPDGGGAPAGRRVGVKGCSGAQNQGLDDAFAWMTKSIRAAL